MPGPIFYTETKTQVVNSVGWGVGSLVVDILVSKQHSMDSLMAGLKMLYEAWRMKPNEGEETQREVEEELAR